LVVLSGVLKGHAFWIERQLMLIGRAPECEIRMDESSVSRHHAELKGGAESWMLRDLGSKNGSFIGERSISSFTAICDGDLCRFGSITLQFFMVQAEISLETNNLNAHGLSLDAARMLVLFEDQSVLLTETEFRMLAALMRRPGRVLSSLALMRAAYPRESVVAEATIASHLRNLRRKIAQLSGEEWIRSYYGRGYALAHERAHVASHA
jgi:pSer/pThr/pTyr-binding forkhead associated (FHA) protein